MRLDWQPVVDGDGVRFAPWLRKLYKRRVSGVYVIRDGSSHEVLYVGESHGATLYGTLTRHFQTWSRSSRSARSLPYSKPERAGSDHDPGLTYDRRKVEVALRAVHERLTVGDVVRIQNRMIRTMRPRDNIVGAGGAGPDVVLPF